MSKVSGKAFDVKLLRRVLRYARPYNAIFIPSLFLTILGGAGSEDDIHELWSKAGFVGASAGSLFVFKGKFRAVLINYPDPLEKENILEGISFN